MNKDIILITTRDKNDHTRSYLKENLEFHSRSLEISDKHIFCNGYNTIIVDQFIGKTNAVSLLSEIRGQNEEASIYLLTSREFTSEEENKINEFKISIFSLPISEVELFNRIIA